MGKGDRVLALAGLGFLPRELKRIGASVQVAPWSDPPQPLAPPGFDFRHSIGPRCAASFLRRASFGKAQTPLVPYFWRTPDEKIVIFSRASE